MRLKRIFLSFILIISLLTISPAASAAGANDIIRQMMNYYECYQEDSWTDVERLLLQLEQIDTAKAVQWREMMESWNRANTTIDFESDTLPHDLPNDDSLCIVVMGYELGSGGTMQEELVGRMQIALTAAEQYPNAYILVTGGATGYHSAITEAEAMADWLAAKGVPHDRIIQETNALSTEKNAINGLRILKSDYPQVKHLAIVTSDYHMIRSHLVFAARQAAIGDDIIDIVAHACYQTDEENGLDISIQADLITMMTGLSSDGMAEPKLSKVTGLTLTGSNIREEGAPLNIIVTAEYDTGFSRDVTADAIFSSSYDPEDSHIQIIDVSLTENGITVTDTIRMEIISTTPETAAETEAATTATEATIPPETADSPEEDTELKWLLGIAAVLLLILIVILYEIWQTHQRRQRRKRRSRKKINLE